MDNQPIVDHGFALPVVEEEMPGIGATRSTPVSVSERIAAASVYSASASERVQFSGEDSRHSLAEMAQTDLDAALQLLAERARYITGASGAAIALRRGEHNDMICRASAGSNAPELGALLSMEHGLSGESVRMRQALRCDEAERDPRVNREVCRQLGIASAVVMPIVSEEKVFGVFELLSGRPRAFDERDLSALQRLSEMVETAVMHAVAAQTMAVQEPESQAAAGEIAVEAVKVEAPVKVGQPIEREPQVTVTTPAVVSAPPEKDIPARELTSTELGSAKLDPAAKKPVFWSAAMRTPASTERDEAAARSMAVPPVLRHLQKCKACGFPVSQGRTFCVECEEKQWRGQRLPQPAPGAGKQAPAQAKHQSARSMEEPPTLSVSKSSASGQTSAKSPVIAHDALTVAPLSGATSSSDTPFPDTPSSNTPSSDTPGNLRQKVSADASVPDNSAPFLSSTVQSESWFAANKYILGALLVVALIIGAVTWLR